MLNNYVKYFSVYFGDFAYDFTIHAHLHLVKQHGPLKSLSHSQFIFMIFLRNHTINSIIWLI